MTHIILIQFLLNIKRTADDSKFKKNYGTISKSYPRYTFDKERASTNHDYEFVSFGHPLLEAVIKWVEDNFSK